jgi:hypothetical protein
VKVDIGSAVMVSISNGDLDDVVTDGDVDGTLKSENSLEGSTMGLRLGMSDGLTVGVLDSTGSLVKTG